MLYDYCIVGGGIVGLATAMKLLEMQPGASLILLEKETVPGRHQTGHNSGVIHAGVYYAPGGLKAELCRRGAIATKEFCAEHSIPFDVCGKMVVATDEVEAKRMDTIFERATQNNVAVEKIDGAELKRREPNIVGVGALFVSTTEIVDYKRVCVAMAETIRKAGGEINFSIEVDLIYEGGNDVTVGAGEQRWHAKCAVICGGLQSDRLARLAGMKIDHQIIPFRGEYFQLPPSRNQIVKSLIYPVPDPTLPFLGVHLTRMIDGSVTVGPNAVLGFAREGYPKASFNARDVFEYAMFPGFWKTIFKHRKSAMHEMTNSLAKTGYLEECRKYCPALAVEDLQPYEAGIRAQAVRRDGSMVDDFLFLETDRMLHVCNAPSPAATSSMPIGEMIAKKCIERHL